MIATEPAVSNEGRYSVTQTCEALKIHKNTLRSYTVQGFIRCGFRRGTCRKFYSGAEIRRFWRATM
jgi:DNA-binding transcriptional MerR regulator